MSYNNSAFFARNADLAEYRCSKRKQIDIRDRLVRRMQETTPFPISGVLPCCHFLNASESSFERMASTSPKTPEAKAIVVLCGCDHGLLVTKIRVEEHGNLISVRTLVPVSVPMDRRAAISEFAMVIHWGLPHGHFQLQLDGDELQFMTNAYLEQTVPDDNFLAHLLVGSHLIVDSTIPAFEAIAKLGRSAAEALEDFFKTARARRQIRSRSRCPCPTGAKTRHVRPWEPTIRQLTLAQTPP